MKQPRSDAQIEASRANGAKSHGPVTPEGKAVSKFNALRHGIFTPALLLPGESEDELFELIETYTREFHPRFPSEYALIDEMVAARWRILRLHRFEQQHPPASLADMERSARLHARLQRLHDSAVKLILLAQQAGTPVRRVPGNAVGFAVVTIGRGSVVVVELDPAVGHEQRGTRPCLVVSHPEVDSNQRYPLLCVVPVTGTPGKELLDPLRAQRSLPARWWTTCAPSTGAGSARSTDRSPESRWLPSTPGW